MRLLHSQLAPGSGVRGLKCRPQACHLEAGPCCCPPAGLPHLDVAEPALLVQVLVGKALGVLADFPRQRVVLPQKGNDGIDLGDAIIACATRNEVRKDGAGMDARRTKQGARQ